MQTAKQDTSEQCALATKQANGMGWVALGKVMPASWGGWSFPSTHHWWDTSGVPGLVLDFPAQEKCGYTGVSSGKSHKNYQETGASDIGRKAERSWVCSAWSREGSEGSLLMCENTWKEGEKWAVALFSGSQDHWGNEHTLKHRRFLLNTRKHCVIVRLTEHWHSSPREFGDTLSLEMFKTHLDLVLGHWF